MFVREQPRDPLLWEGRIRIGKREKLRGDAGLSEAPAGCYSELWGSWSFRESS